jgi:hypothetical protein
MDERDAMEVEVDGGGGEGGWGLTELPHWQPRLVNCSFRCFLSAGMRIMCKRMERLITSDRQKQRPCIYHGHRVRSNIRELQGEMDQIFASQRSGPPV